MLEVEHTIHERALAALLVLPRRAPHTLHHLGGVQLFEILRVEERPQVAVPHADVRLVEHRGKGDHFRLAPLTQVGGVPEERVQDRRGGRLEQPDHGPGANGPGNEPPINLGHLHHLVEEVACERLVRALTCEDHLDVARGLPGQEIHRNDNGIAHRLVHVPNDLREQRQVTGAALDLVVIAAERVGHPARLRELVDRRPEADRERAHRRRAQPMHRADHQARVQPAAQEGTEWDIAHEP